MGSGVFDGRIDVHFGGRDLIFPHHHSEALCCHAFHNDKLTNNNHNNIYDWSKIWIHSGHLNYRHEVKVRLKIITKSCSE